MFGFIHRMRTSSHCYRGTHHERRPNTEDRSEPERNALGNGANPRRPGPGSGSGTCAVDRAELGSLGLKAMRSDRHQEGGFDLKEGWPNSG